MKVEARLIKAITKNPAEVNPAGVILDANQIADQQMIAIAAELGFSESAKEVIATVQ